MKKFFLGAAIVAASASPASAMSHKASDQWIIFLCHCEQMCFWFGQHEWRAAFYQVDCMGDPLMRLLWVHGGVLYITLGLIACATYFSARSARRRLTRLQVA